MGNQWGQVGLPILRYFADDGLIRHVDHQNIVSFIISGSHNLLSYDFKVMHNCLYDYRRFQDHGCTNQVVVTIRVILEDPQAYRVLVSRFACLDQIKQHSIVDGAFLHPHPCVFRDLYRTVEAITKHARTVIQRFLHVEVEYWRCPT